MRLFLFFWFVLCASSLTARGDDWSIQGTLLTPENVVAEGIISISGPKISGIGKTPQVRRGPLVKRDAVIMPGLIDLHNHLTWNVFPRWHPSRRFNNRYEWQEAPDYDRLLKTPQKRLIDDGYGCDASVYAEVKALAPGATSTVGSFSNECISGLVRNLDFKSGFPNEFTDPSPCRALNPAGFPELHDVVLNEVFPLERVHGRVDFLRCELAGERLKGLLVHLSEGNPLDPSARREFSMLKAQGLLMPGLAVIHGTALNPDDFRSLQAAGVGLIWSPRSNDELYGASANISAAQNAGVTIAIAPDWSPTGSDGMLQELNYAASKYPTYFDAKQLVMMATSIPARLVRLNDRIGKLEVGLYADLLVIRSRGSMSPYETAISASPADVDLVVIGGQPVYGDLELLKSLLPGKAISQLTVCGALKGIYLGEVDTPSLRDWSQIRARLGAELARNGTTLAGFDCN